MILDEIWDGHEVWLPACTCSQDVQADVGSLRGPNPARMHEHLHPCLVTEARQLQKLLPVPTGLYPHFCVRQNSDMCVQHHKYAAFAAAPIRPNILPLLGSSIQHREKVRIQGNCWHYHFCSQALPQVLRQHLLAWPFCLLLRLPGCVAKGKVEGLLTQRHQAAVPEMALQEVHNLMRGWAQLQRHGVFRAGSSRGIQQRLLVHGLGSCLLAHVHEVLVWVVRVVGRPDAPCCSGLMLMMVVVVPS